MEVGMKKSVREKRRKITLEDCGEGTALNNVIATSLKAYCLSASIVNELREPAVDTYKIGYKEITSIDLFSRDDWRDKESSHPERTVRLATCFSGIGAIEQAFKRLRIRHKIIFAGD